jgi:CubicO group peptidase (beta-lactamase class C family)
MHSGLEWVEEYVEGRGSDVIAMLFGDGAVDMAAFAEAKPLAAPPGTVHNYSSGTSNILARCVQRVLDLDGQGIQAYLAERLFGPLGMTSARAEVDGAGTWVASSYVYATARDFARFGQFYLNDGTWQGERLLPDGWVAYGRSPTASDPERAYGAHWWLANDGHGSFAAHGYEGQRIRCVPDRDLVIVRLGKTPAPDVEPPRDAVSLWVDDVVACFAR